MKVNDVLNGALNDALNGFLKVLGVRSDAQN